MRELVGLFKALSDETRLRILKLLDGGELCVCDLFSALDVIQPKASFHLGVLKEAGLIRDRKEGRWVHYHIDDADIFRRFLILSVLERIPDAVVAADKERLDGFVRNKTRSATRSPLADYTKKTGAERCQCLE